MNLIHHIPSHISPNLGQPLKNIHFALAMASATMYTFQNLPNLRTSLTKYMVHWIHDV